VPENQHSCPMTRPQVVDRYYLEHRAKLIDIAAYLDRFDRAAEAAQGSTAQEDFRMAAFRRAMAILQDDRPERARRVMESLSDPTTEPIDSAHGVQGAFGAYPPESSSGAGRDESAGDSA